VDPVPTPTPTQPGQLVSAAARNASGIQQVGDNLDRAAAFLKAGRLAAARQQLDAAERKLVYVTDSDAHSALAARLADLRAQLAAQPTAAPSHGRPAGKPGKAQPAPGGSKAPDKSTGPAGSGSNSRPNVVPSQSARNNTGPGRSSEVRHPTAPEGSGKGQAGAHD
jgi:hypothetical protein